MEKRYDLKNVPMMEQESPVSRVVMKTNGENRFLVWSLPVEKGQFRTVNEIITTPIKGGNGEIINTKNVVKAVFDVYELTNEEHKFAWFCKGVYRNDGSYTDYQYAENNVEIEELSQEDI